MSAGLPVAKRLFQWKPSPRVVSFFLVAGTFVCMLFAQRSGLIQSLEFKVYDFFIRQQPKAPTSDPIVLIEMTEEDIQHPTLDYPIHDNKLAELLRVLEEGKPNSIGLDIWRDVPVPKSGVGLAEFNEVLRTNGNICAIFTLGGVNPPAVLGWDPTRVVFNDNLLIDDGVDHTIPKVRRTMLTGRTKDSKVEGDFMSLPFLLALQYLHTRGIEPEMAAETPHLMRLGKVTLEQFRSNDGAYVKADASGWQIFLDFKCPDNFTRFTVMQALTGKIPPDALRDKILIVGINTTTVEDNRVTPTHFNHRGIEVQAAAVNQLLRIALEGEKPIQVWPDWLEDLWMLFWCLVGGTIGYRVNSPGKFMMESALCLAAIVIAAWVSYFRGWWIPIATPALAYIPAAVLVTSYVTSHERAMRGALMNLYARSVSREIARSLWENRDSFMDGGRPLAQKVVVTALFTDLKGFSTVSEKMEPSELYEWLNGYLGAMAQEVQAHGGELKQYTGDGILAFFGVPEPRLTTEGQARDATAAVRCALAMGRRMIGLSKEWTANGLPKVSMRAGIYTGEVTAGCIGSDERFEYACIGDVVNTASRLESYDKTFADPDLLPNRCRILIGEATHALLTENFVSKEIGMLEVKGKANKVSVFQILDEAPATDGPK